MAAPLGSVTVPVMEPVMVRATRAGTASDIKSVLRRALL